PGHGVLRPVNVVAWMNSAVAQKEWGITLVTSARSPKAAKRITVALSGAQNAGKPAYSVLVIELSQDGLRQQQTTGLVSFVLDGLVRRQELPILLVGISPLPQSLLRVVARHHH